MNDVIVTYCDEASDVRLLPIVADGSSLCLAAVICFWLTLFLNFVLFLVCVYLLYQAIQENQPKITTTIKILVPLLPLLRMINMILVGEAFFLDEEKFGGTTKIFDVITAELIAYLFISIYSLLVIFWMVLYLIPHVTTQEILETMKKVVLWVNSVMYGIWITILFLMLFLHHHRPLIQIIEGCYIGTLNFAVFLAFAFFGNRLEYQLKNVVIASLSTLTISRKVRLLTIVCGCVFCTRSILIFMDVFLNPNRPLTFGSNVVFSLFCETFPTGLILYILRVEVTPTEGEFRDETWSEESILGAQNHSSSSFHSFDTTSFLSFSQDRSNTGGNSFEPLSSTSIN